MNANKIALDSLLEISSRSLFKELILLLSDSRFVLENFKPKFNKIFSWSIKIFFAVSKYSLNLR